MIKLSVEMNIILNLSTLQLIMCWCFAVQRSEFPPEAALLLKIFHSLYLHVFNSTFNIVLMLYLNNSTLNNHNNIRTLHIYTITVSVLYWSLCCLGKYFYFENLKNRYFMLTNILPFPVSPAGYFEFNLCAITLENSVFYAAVLTLIYVIKLYKVLPAVIIIIIIINTELWACKASQSENAL